MMTTWKFISKFSDPLYSIKITHIITANSLYMLIHTTFFSIQIYCTVSAKKDAGKEVQSQSNIVHNGSFRHINTAIFFSSFDIGQGLHFTSHFKMFSLLKNFFLLLRTHFKFWDRHRHLAIIFEHLPRYHLFLYLV